MKPGEETTGSGLPILYLDDTIVVVNKPSGLLVHRSPIDRHETRFAVQMVRDQLGRRVYPVHRLDKGTSGALAFALDRETARSLAEAFASHHVSLDEAPQAYADFQHKAEGTFKVVFHP